MTLQSTLRSTPTLDALLSELSSLARWWLADPVNLILLIAVLVGGLFLACLLVIKLVHSADRFVIERLVKERIEAALTSVPSRCDPSKPRL